LGDIFGRRILRAARLVPTATGTDRKVETNGNQRRGDADGDQCGQRQSFGSVLDFVNFVVLDVKRDLHVAEHAGVVVLGLEFKRQNKAIPVAVGFRKGAMEWVHAPDAAADVGLFAGAVPAVASDVGDIFRTDPSVTVRAVIAGIGAKELAVGVVVAGPVFGHRIRVVADGVIFNGMEFVAVAIRSGRVGRKDLVIRIDRVSVFVLVGQAVVLFYLVGAGGALKVHSLTANGDAGAHEGVFAFTVAIIDALLFQSEVVVPEFSVFVAGGFAVLSAHRATRCSGLHIDATAETGVVLLG